MRGGLGLAAQCRVLPDSKRIAAVLRTEKMDKSGH
jgi:hypothetical protein